VSRADVAHPASSRVPQADPARACDACLRKAHLIGHLAGHIAGVLATRGGRTPGLLGLGEEDLVAAVAPRAEQLAEALRFLDGFDVAAARSGLSSAGIASLCRHTGRYPAGLRDLDDAPAALFVTGGVARLNELCTQPVVAIVGTRQASPYGSEVAQALGRGLAAAGVTVVSGLALGIDAAAHRGSLEAAGGAVAVLAGGVDVPYPRHNLQLYRRLREHGVIVSELPPGRRPLRWSFPARNRIMAALAGVTVVVEAADRSGSLITASFAAQLGRTVAAVPGRVTSDKTIGSNRLLREGAAFVRGPEDILDELFGVGRWAQERLPQPPDPAEELEPALRRVLEAVEDGEDVEGVARTAGLSPAAARAALGRLEADGLVARAGVGAFERTLG